LASICPRLTTDKQQRFQEYREHPAERQVLDSLLWYSPFFFHYFHPPCYPGLPQFHDEIKLLGGFNEDEHHLEQLNLIRHTY